VPLAQADISAAYDTQPIDKASGDKVWTITTMVQEWLANPAINTGLLLNADVPIPPDQLMPLALAVVDWAKAREVALVVTLEGEPRGDTTTSAALSCSSNLPGEAIAKKLGAQPRHGSLVGLAPAFLVHGNRAGLPVVAFFAPAEVADGDARAAIQVLRTLAPLVPALALDAPAIEARAQHIAERVGAEQTKHQREIRRLAERTMRGYA